MIISERFKITKLQIPKDGEVKGRKNCKQTKLSSADFGRGNVALRQDARAR